MQATLVAGLVLVGSVGLVVAAPAAAAITWAPCAVAEAAEESREGVDDALDRLEQGGASPGTKPADARGALPPVDLAQDGPIDCIRNARICPEDCPCEGTILQ